jgi:hypothetical protein
MVRPLRKVVYEVSLNAVATIALMKPEAMLNASLIQYISTRGLKRFRSSQSIF